MPYVIDREPHQPGDSHSDWHAWIKRKDADGSKHMLVQFAASFGDEDEAKRIVRQIVAGLNDAVCVPA